MKELKIKITRDDVEAFVKVTNRFDFDVDICSEDNHYIIDAKSIMGIFSLDLSRPTIIKVSYEGPETELLFNDLMQWKY